MRLKIRTGSGDVFSPNSPGRPAKLLATSLKRPWSSRTTNSRLSSGSSDESAHLIPGAKGFDDEGSGRYVGFWLISGRSGIPRSDPLRDIADHICSGRVLRILARCGPAGLQQKHDSYTAGTMQSERLGWSVRNSHQHRPPRLSAYSVSMPDVASNSDSGLIIVH